VPHSVQLLLLITIIIIIIIIIIFIIIIIIIVVVVVVIIIIIIIMRWHYEPKNRAVDANGLKRILKSFKKSSANLCDALAAMTRA